MNTVTEAHKKEAVKLINVSKEQKKLDKLKEKFSAFMLEDDEEKWFYKIVVHEAAHKTVDEVLTPRS